MKNRILLLAIAFCSAPTSLVFAQEATTTDDQKAAIEALVVEINNACAAPTIPAIPAEEGVTQEQLVAAQKELKAYIKVGNDYLGCLDSKEKAWGKDENDTQKAVVTAMYNKTVDTMTETANTFNTRVRDFKAANAKK